MQESWHIAIIFGTIGLSLAIAAVSFAVIMVKLAVETWRG
jgi:hypothetical protein